MTIKNANQRRVTQEQLQKLIEERDRRVLQTDYARVYPAFYKAGMDGLQSMIDELSEEIADYDAQAADECKDV